MPHTTHTSALTARSFTAAPRIHEALTAPLERRTLHWLAVRAPRWLTSDQLTALGLAAQLAAGCFYALAATHRRALLLVNLCILLNWLGDSLDGTLARVRQQLRPRYGFYVDHIVDLFGTLALLGGLGLSGFAHWAVAAAMLVAFLLLSAESYLTTYTLGRFELSPGPFGPTELRLLLITANFALLRSPYATVFGHRWLLFDLGGTIGSVCMFGTLLALTARHTAELHRAEPLASSDATAGPSHAE